MHFVKMLAVVLSLIPLVFLHWWANTQNPTVIYNLILLNCYLGNVFVMYSKHPDCDVCSFGHPSNISEPVGNPTVIYNNLNLFI